MPKRKRGTHRRVRGEKDTLPESQIEVEEGEILEETARREHEEAEKPSEA